MNSYLSYIISIAEPSKYATWYSQLITNASIRTNNENHNIEKHHILPKCFKCGGERDGDNLISLSSREHFIAHALLSKMFTARKRIQMQHAFWAMCSLFTKGRRDTSRFYESAKRALVQARRGRTHSNETRKKMSDTRKGTHTGYDNHMYGKTGSAHHNYGKPGPMLGRTHSDETKQKLSGPNHHNYGKPGPMLGRTHSDETKVRISTNNGMKHDPYAASRVRWTHENRQKQQQLMQGSGNSNAKMWKITNTLTNEVVTTDDLKLFCHTRGWKYKSLMSCRSSGKPYKNCVIEIL